jgi:hypothetical protein
MDMQKKKEEQITLENYQTALWHKMSTEGLQESKLSIGDAYRMGQIMNHTIAQLLAEKDKEFRNNVIRLFYIKDFPLQTPRGHEKWLKDFIAKFGLDKAMRDIENLPWEEIKEMHFNSPITNN